MYLWNILRGIDELKKKLWLKATLSYCAGSPGAVHSVSLINVYLDLESPGGAAILGGGVQKGYWGNKKGQFASVREQRWTIPVTAGGCQVSGQGE